jgi:HPt (histidine-containing phosphotransfer) domain-containing protein
MDATRIAQALDRGDSEQVHRVAHALFGSASTLGADAIAAAARRLDRSALPDTSTGAAEARQAALADLRAGLASLAQALGEAPAPADAAAETA